MHHRRFAAIAILAAALVAAISPSSRAATTPVTVWTEAADALGRGNANWHTLAIMHIAMHDALNAADPVFARWSRPEIEEPYVEGALPQAALAAAAATVLTTLHPASRDSVGRLLETQLATLPAGAPRQAGIRLGNAIADATLARRRNDGFARARLFPGSDVPGIWRPTPPNGRSSGKTEARPFLFNDVAAIGGLPPPTPGSPAYLSDVAEVRRLGGAVSTDRTEAQSEAALFWAYQSTQRGFVHLAASMVERLPLPDGLAGQARLMSQMAVAMADSTILIWDAKAHWNYWRPVTAITSGAFGVDPDPAWSSFIETPPHPEYPSGHASDCYTGAGLLRRTFSTDTPFIYTAQSPDPSPARPPEVWTSDTAASDDNQPVPPVELVAVTRPFSSLTEAARNCADSRIWAGAHFPSANEESRQIAFQIVERALAAVPRLTPASPVALPPSIAP